MSIQVQYDGKGHRIGYAAFDHRVGRIVQLPILGGPTYEQLINPGRQDVSPLTEEVKKGIELLSIERTRAAFATRVLKNS